MTRLTINELLRETINHLVDTDDVVFEEQSGDHTMVVNIVPPKDEIGKVIGGKGKVITAIRTIFETIAAKQSKRINIHVID